MAFLAGETDVKGCVQERWLGCHSFPPPRTAGGCSNGGEEGNKRMDFAHLNLNLGLLENIK